MLTLSELKMISRHWSKDTSPYSCGTVMPSVLKTVFALLAENDELKAQLADAGAPLELLNGSVASLEKALKSGKHDPYLEALLRAEQGDKARKGALAAIEERMA